MRNTLIMLLALLPAAVPSSGQTYLSKESGISLR